MIRLICLLVTIGLSASAAVAQEAQRPQDVWRERAQSFTNDSLKDIKSLETLEGALMLGQLGAQWWNTDPGQANVWLIKAVEAVELVPARENSAERGRRLAVARSLLPVISNADQKLWERLQAVLIAGQVQSADPDRKTSADSLVETALVVLKTDPRRAASMGSAALRIGPPTSLQHLLWALRKRDSLLADELFNQALAVARRTPDEDFLNSLRYAAFPELSGAGYDSKTAPPDTIRRALLLIVADYLQQHTASLANKGARDCGLAPALVAGLQNQFDTLEPRRADLVRQIVRTCAESAKRSDDPASDPEPVGLLETVDSLLARADQTADKKIKRPNFLAQAARLAAQQKNFERAIKIIEGMSDEERSFIGVWETWRRDWAVALAIEFLKRDDVYGMQQVIKAVPDLIRPFAKIYLVDRLPRDLYAQVAREALDESRKDLGNSETADLEKAYWYLMVVRLYSKFHFDNEAVEVFKETIVSLNRAKRERPTEAVSPFEDLTTKVIQADFPVSLLESYPYLTNEVVSSITSVPRRARVRLDLVQISLREYRRLAAKHTPETKTLTKKPNEKS